MAATYRIPHSQFLAWSEGDRDKALWHHVRQCRTCPGCGTRPEQWDPNQGGHPAAFIPVVERCEGCHVLHSHDEQKDDPASHAFLRRNPKAVKRAQTVG